MKKTYINPNIEVIKIQTQQMLADSLTLGTGTTPTNPSASDAHDDDFDW